MIAATLFGAVAGLLAVPALLAVGERIASTAPAMVGPLIRSGNEALERVLRPLHLAGAEGAVPTDRERLRFSVGVGAVGLVAGFATGGKVVAAGAALGSVWLGSHAFAWRRDRYRRRLDAAAAGVALALADALDAGHSVRAALIEAGRGMTGPIAAELGRVTSELDLGAETDESLEGLRMRAGSRRLSLIVAAVRIQRRAGGSLATLLRDIARTVEEHDRLEDEARAASAQARFTSVVVLCLPLFGLALAELAAPGIVGRMTVSAASRWLLGAALALQLAGVFLIRRLSLVDT